MSKKRKNFINIKDAIAIFKAYGMEVREHLPWQFMIFPDESNNRYDWYHTTGSLVSNIDGFLGSMGKFKDPEDAALQIQAIEEKYHGI